jgi:hypothetical protein
LIRGFDLAFPALGGVLPTCRAADKADNGRIVVARPVPSGGIRVRRRDQILSTTAELFATKGYTKTSMRGVATVSGILAGSLYHQFDSKKQSRSNWPRTTMPT